MDAKQFGIFTGAVGGGSKMTTDVGRRCGSLREGSGFRGGREGACWIAAVAPPCEGDAADEAPEVGGP